MRRFEREPDTVDDLEPQVRRMVDADDDLLDVDDLQDVDDEEEAYRPRRRRRGARRSRAQADGPRTGMKRSLMHTITQIPAYLRLLVGLVGDRRVSRLDRFLVIGAIAYIVSPIDFVPDLIPFLGQVDDVFLLMMALQRLVENTGPRVLRDHWRGDLSELDGFNIASIVSAAGFFLPARTRRRLRRMAGGR